MFTTTQKYFRGRKPKTRILNVSQKQITLPQNKMTTFSLLKGNYIAESK